MHRYWCILQTLWLLLLLLLDLCVCVFCVWTREKKEREFFLLKCFLPKFHSIPHG